MHSGTHGNTHNEVTAPSAMPVSALASLTIASTQNATPTHFPQRPQPGIRLQQHITAPTAIATVRTSAGDVTLPPKGDTAVSPVTTPRCDLNTINHISSLVLLYDYMAKMHL